MAASAELGYNSIQITANSSGTLTSAILPYVVRDAADEAAAIAAVMDESDSTYQGLYRQEFTIRERIAETDWRVEASYQGNTSEVQIAFDTTGATQHIDIGFEQIAAYAVAGSTAPSVHGAIGVEGTVPGAPVKGADIVGSQYQFTETHYLSRSTVDSDYRNAIARKSSMYNNQPFRGFNPCEVLFLGASGRIQGNGRGDVWEIQFQFAVARNQINIAVGDIVVLRKRGWEYLWVMYDNEISQNRFVKKPVAAFVNKVYLGTDFSSLGIGTGTL